MQNLAEQSKQAPLPRAPQQPVASQSYTPADAQRDMFAQQSAPNQTHVATGDGRQNA